MAVTKIDRLQQIGLASLEVIVLALFLVIRFVNLSSLELWGYWLGLVFFWLTILLLAASIKMFSKHRRLAVAGLILFALILLNALFSLPTLHHK